MDDLGTVLVAAAVGFLVVALYVYPASLAYKNRHPYALAILWLVLLTGWTGWGWVVALVWALANPRKKEA